MRQVGRDEAVEALIPAVDEDLPAFRSVVILVRWLTRQERVDLPVVKVEKVRAPVRCSAAQSSSRAPRLESLICSEARTRDDCAGSVS